MPLSLRHCCHHCYHPFTVNGNTHCPLLSNPLCHVLIPCSHSLALPSYHALLRLKFKSIYREVTAETDSSKWAELQWCYHGNVFPTIMILLWFYLALVAKCRKVGSWHALLMGLHWHLLGVCTSAWINSCPLVSIHITEALEPVPADATVCSFSLYMWPGVPYTATVPFTLAITSPWIEYS